MNVTRFDIIMHTSDPADTRTVAVPANKMDVTLEQAGACHDSIASAVRNAVAEWKPVNEFAPASDDHENTEPPTG